jgi:F0F1-type ATP synthase beta subunit
MEIYGIRLDSRIRSFLAQNYFVIDRFYFTHGELVDIVYDHVYSKYDVYGQYQYLPDHFDYSKNTQIDKIGKKWFCLQSFGIENEK